VQNAGTTFAVYEAVLKNKPLFERIITVSGNACAKPANYRVRIGTPISFLINKTQSSMTNIDKVILGGPMMGTAITNIDAPTTKLTSGVLLLQGSEFGKHLQTNCIRCGKCATVCPAGLRPYAIKDAVLHNGGVSELKELHALDCIECGCCAFTCPAHLPLLDYCKLAKQELRKK